ncbi:PREDICTED: beta-1,3-galactosyltransferase 1-like [Branchiostoma belcheri]|uniref:Hexosyltransferase n=1 Tax=Branchiostoma belcheri TaxID=7741 RepID=A0A6P4YTD1_BRABE|nr:PREDICTED: beta-1,3-galactosyltransferase 1-like [Branchiostoma belcheri]
MVRLWARLTLKRFVILSTVAGFFYISSLVVTRWNTTEAKENEYKDGLTITSPQPLDENRNLSVMTNNSDRGELKSISAPVTVGGARKEDSHERPGGYGHHLGRREKESTDDKRVEISGDSHRHQAGVLRRRAVIPAIPIQIQMRAVKAKIEKENSQVQTYTTTQESGHTDTEVINPHPYTFTINNPGKCSVSDVFLLIMVTSAPMNSSQRHAIRRTWGNESNSEPGTVIKTVFTVGKTNKSSIQLGLERENMLHKDIIQEDFVDSYKNLTLKTVMCLKWASEFCPGAKFVMKADDDTFVNIYSLVRHLKHMPASNTSKLVTGYVYTGSKPVRVSHSKRGKYDKWYVSKEEYPRETFPKYPCGFAYVMSNDVIRPLYEVSLTLKYVFLEDVFLGLCLEKLGIEPTHQRGFNIRKAAITHCISDKQLASHWHKTPHDMVHAWNRLSHNCKVEKYHARNQAYVHLRSIREWEYLERLYNTNRSLI